MNNQSKSCLLSTPYPSTAVCAQNQRYANLLMQDYAGPKSELTAITQYLYQHFEVGATCPMLADSLQCIAGVEMHHMELLGEMIVNLGGNPQMRSGCGGSFWSGRYPTYCTDICAFLRANIAAEKGAIATYKLRVQQIQDEKVQAVLCRIIMDEEHHIEIFKDYLTQLCSHC